jgi:membrane-associated phospholipid phosphatase
MISQMRTEPRFERRPIYLLYAAVALLLLVPMSLAVDGNEISDAEQAVFEMINGLPAFLYWPLWPFMQLGNLLVVPLAAIVAAGFRQWRLAVAILAAGGLKLFLEDVLKSLVFRERPGSVVSDVILRGDTNAAGQAFVSGHAVIVMALVTLVWPYLNRRWRIVAAALGALVAVARVYAGAHFPLDVIGGSLLGFAIGCILNVVVETPARRARKVMKLR